MDTIKQEDCFSDDLATQNERQVFHKVITVKSSSNAVLPDDNDHDMAIKTEIKPETSFPEREYFTKHVINQIGFEAVTSKNNCKSVTEVKIEEQALDSDLSSQKEPEFLTQDPAMKANKYNSYHEGNDKIEIKVEPWWLETETSAACDAIKDEDFPPVISSRSCMEEISGAVSVELPLLPAEVSGRYTSFSNGKNHLECEHQKSDVTEVSIVEEYVLPEQSGKCSEQGEICTRPLFLKQKTLVHQGKRTHECKTCGKSFSHLSSLKTHNMVHEGKRPHQCTSCSKSFIQLSHLKTHNLIHEGKKPHKCKTCDKSFTRSSVLNRHILIHEGKKPHKCSTCDKSFTDLSHLKRHYLIHEGKKPHHCNSCDKNFTQLSALKIHSMIHEDKRPHQCKSCDKSFALLSHLKTHNLIHEGKKPHKCKTCDKRFTRLSDLNKHYLTHEGKKPHQCKACDKSFTRLSHLKRHYLIHEAKKPHQ